MRLRDPLHSVTRFPVDDVIEIEHLSLIFSKIFPASSRELYQL